MKNKEKYLDELAKAFTDRCFDSCEFKKNYVIKTKSCTSIDCLTCDRLTAEWLEQEYQKPITLTDDEKVILKNIDKDYKWVARDKNDNLYVYNEKPIRSVSNSEWIGRHRFITINAFKHLFKLVKWEDEPYNIDELLKQNGVERNEE